MSKLEELKKKANEIDKNIAILNSDLKKLMDKLQEDFNIIGTNQAEKHIVRIEKKKNYVIKKINRLYSQAEATLEGIEK